MVFSPPIMVKFSSKQKLLKARIESGGILTIIIGDGRTTADIFSTELTKWRQQGYQEIPYDKLQLHQRITCTHMYREDGGSLLVLALDRPEDLSALLADSTFQRYFERPDMVTVQSSGACSFTLLSVLRFCENTRRLSIDVVGATTEALNCLPVSFTRLEALTLKQDRQQSGLSLCSFLKSRFPIKELELIRSQIDEGDLEGLFGPGLTKIRISNLAESNVAKVSHILEQTDTQLEHLKVLDIRVPVGSLASCLEHLVSLEATNLTTWDLENLLGSCGQDLRRLSLECPSMGLYWWWTSGLASIIATNCPTLDVLELSGWSWFCPLWVSILSQEWHRRRNRRLREFRIDVDSVFTDWWICPPKVLDYYLTRMTQEVTVSMDEVSLFRIPECPPPPYSAVDPY